MLWQLARTQVELNPLQADEEEVHLNNTLPQVCTPFTSTSTLLEYQVELSPEGQKLIGPMLSLSPPAEPTCRSVRASPWPEGKGEGEGAEEGLSLATLVTVGSAVMAHGSKVKHSSAYKMGILTRGACDGGSS